MATRIRFRRDTAANWSNTATAAALAPGEIGVELDTRRVKIGPASDSQTPWNSINYSYIPQKVTDTIFLMNEVFGSGASIKTLTLDGIWLNTSLPTITNGNINLYLNQLNGTRTKLYDSRISLTPSSLTQPFTINSPVNFIYLSNYTVEVRDNNQTLIGSLTVKYIPPTSPTIRITCNFISTSIIQVNVYNNFPIPVAGNFSTNIYSPDGTNVDSTFPHTSTPQGVVSGNLPAVDGENFNTVLITLSSPGAVFVNNNSYYIELTYDSTNQLSVFSENITLVVQTLTALRFNPDNNSEVFGNIVGDRLTSLQIGSIDLSYIRGGVTTNLQTYNIQRGGVTGNTTILLKTTASGNPNFLPLHEDTIRFQSKTVTGQLLGGIQTIILNQDVIIENVALTSATTFSVGAVATGDAYNVKVEIYEQGDSSDVFIESVSIPSIELVADTSLVRPGQEGTLASVDPLDIVADSSVILKFYGMTGSFLNSYLYYNVFPTGPADDKKGYSVSTATADNLIHDQLVKMADITRRIRLYGNIKYDETRASDKSYYHQLLRVIGNSSNARVRTMQLLLESGPTVNFSPPTSAWYTSQRTSINGKSILTPHIALQTGNRFDIIIDAILTYGTGNIIGIAMGNEIILNANSKQCSGAGAINYLNSVTAYFECFRKFFADAKTNNWTSTVGNRAINAIPLGIFDAGGSYSPNTSAGRPTLYLPYRYVTTIIQLCDWHGVNDHPVYGGGDFFAQEDSVPVPYDPSRDDAYNSSTIGRSSIRAAKTFITLYNNTKKDILNVLKELEGFGANQDIQLVIGEVGWPSFGRAYAKLEDPEISTTPVTGPFPTSRYRYLNPYITPYHAYTYINEVTSILKDYTVNGKYIPYYLFAFNDSNNKQVTNGGTFETCWGLNTQPWYSRMMIRNVPVRAPSQYNSTNNAYLIMDPVTGLPVLDTANKPTFNLTIPATVIRFTHNTISGNGPPWRIGEILRIINTNDNSSPKKPLNGKYKVYYSNTVWTDVDISKDFTSGPSGTNTDFNYSGFSKIVAENYVELHRTDLSIEKFDLDLVSTGTTGSFTTELDINYQTYYPRLDTTTITPTNQFSTYKNYKFKFFPGGKTTNVNTITGGSITVPQSNTISNVGYTSSLRLITLFFQSPSYANLVFFYNGTTIPSATIEFKLFDVTISESSPIYTTTVTTLETVTVTSTLPNGQTITSAVDQDKSLGPINSGATFIPGHFYDASITYPFGTTPGGDQAYVTIRLPQSVEFNPFRITNVTGNPYEDIEFDIIPLVDDDGNRPVSSTVSVYVSDSINGARSLLVSGLSFDIPDIDTGNQYANSPVTYTFRTERLLSELYGKYISLGGTFSYISGPPTIPVYGSSRIVDLNLTLIPPILVIGSPPRLSYSLNQNDRDLIPWIGGTGSMTYKLRSYIHLASVTPSPPTNPSNQLIFEHPTSTTTTTLSSGITLTPGTIFTDYKINIRLHKLIYGIIGIVNGTTAQLTFTSNLGISPFSVGDTITIIGGSSSFGVFNGNKTITSISGTSLRFAYNGSYFDGAGSSCFLTAGDEIIPDTPFNFYNYAGNIVPEILSLNAAGIVCRITFTNYGRTPDKIPFPNSGVSYFLYEALTSSPASYTLVNSTNYIIADTTALPIINPEDKSLFFRGSYSLTFGNYYKIAVNAPANVLSTQTNFGPGVRYTFPADSSLSFTFTNPGNNRIDGKIYVTVAGWSIILGNIDVSFNIFEDASTDLLISTITSFSLTSETNNFVLTPIDPDTGDIINLIFSKRYYVTLSLANGYTPLTTSSLIYSPLRIALSDSIPYSIGSNRIEVGPFTFVNPSSSDSGTFTATLTYTTPATDVDVGTTTFAKSNTSITLLFSGGAARFLKGTYSVTILYRDYNAITNSDAKVVINNIIYQIPDIEDARTTVSFEDTVTKKGWLNASIAISSVPPVSYIEFYVNEYAGKNDTTVDAVVDSLRFSNTFTPTSLQMLDNSLTTGNIKFYIPQNPPTTPSEFQLQNLVSKTVQIACSNTISFSGGATRLNNLDGNYIINEVTFNAGRFQVLMRNTDAVRFSVSPGTLPINSETVLSAGSVTIFDNSRLNLPTADGSELTYAFSSNANKFVSGKWYNVVCNISDFSLPVLANNLQYLPGGYNIIVIAGGKNAFGNDIGASTNDEFNTGVGAFPFYTPDEKTYSLVDCNNNSVKVYDFSPAVGASKIRHALMPLHQFSAVASPGSNIELGYEFINAYLSNPSLLIPSRRVCVIDVSQSNGGNIANLIDQKNFINDALEDISSLSNFYPETRSKTGLFAKNTEYRKRTYGCNGINKNNTQYWQRYVDNFGAVTIENDIQFENIHPNNTRSPANIPDSTWSTDNRLREYFRLSIKNLKDATTRDSTITSIHSVLGSFPLSDFKFAEIAPMCNFLLDNEMKVRVTGLINPFKMRDWVQLSSNISRRSSCMAIASHCYTVVNWFETTYPDMVYAYDVVKGHYYSPITGKVFSTGLDVTNNVDDVLYIEAAFFGAYCGLIKSNRIPGTWSSGKTYSLNMKVEYAGIYYTSLQANNRGQNPSSATSFWKAITSKIANTWVSTISYSLGSKVEYNGVYYISLQATNVNQNPSSASTYWESFTPTKTPRLCWSDDLFDKYGYLYPYFTPGISTQGLENSEQVNSRNAGYNNNIAGDYQATMCKRALERIIAYYDTVGYAIDFPIDCIAFPMHLDIQNFITSPEPNGNFADDGLSWGRRERFFKGTNNALYNRCLMFKNIGSGISYPAGKTFRIDFSEFDVCLFTRGASYGENTTGKPRARILESVYWANGTASITYPAFRQVQYNFLTTLFDYMTSSSLDVVNNDYFSFGELVSPNTVYNINAVFGTLSRSIDYTDKTSILFEMNAAGTISNTTTYNSFSSDIYDLTRIPKTSTSHKVVALLMQFGEEQNSKSLSYPGNVTSTFTNMFSQIDQEFASKMSILIGNLNIDYIGRTLSTNTSGSGKDYRLMAALEDYTLQDKNVTTVSSIGLRSLITDGPVSDNLPLIKFSGRSNRLFGLRYFNAFLRSIITGTVDNKKYPTYTLEVPSGKVFPYKITTVQDISTIVTVFTRKMSYLTSSMPVGYRIFGNIIRSNGTIDTTRSVNAFLPVYSYARNRATTASVTDTPSLIVPYLTPSPETNKFSISNSFDINIDTATDDIPAAVLSCVAIGSTYSYTNNNEIIDPATNNLRDIVLSGSLSTFYNLLSDKASSAGNEGISVVMQGIYYDPDVNYYVSSNVNANLNPVLSINLIRSFSEQSTSPISLRFDRINFSDLTNTNIFPATPLVTGFTGLPPDSYIIAYPEYVGVVVVGTLTLPSSYTITPPGTIGSTYRVVPTTVGATIYTNYILGTSSDLRDGSSGSNIEWSSTSTADNMGLSTILYSKLDWFLFFTRGRRETIRGAASTQFYGQSAGIGLRKNTFPSVLYNTTVGPVSNYFLFIRNTETYIMTKIHNVFANKTYSLSFWFSVRENRVPTERSGLTYSIPAGTRFPIKIFSKFPTAGITPYPIIYTHNLAFTSPGAPGSTTYLHGSSTDWNGDWKKISFTFIVPASTTFASGPYAYMQFGPLPKTGMIDTSFNFTEITINDTVTYPY